MDNDGTWIERQDLGTDLDWPKVLQDLAWVETEYLTESLPGVLSGYIRTLIAELERHRSLARQIESKVRLVQDAVARKDQDLDLCRQQNLSLTREIDRLEANLRMSRREAILQERDRLQSIAEREIRGLRQAIQELLRTIDRRCPR